MDAVDAPGQRQAARRGEAGGEAEHRHVRALPRRAQRRRARGGVGDDGGRRDGMGGMAGGGGDGVGHGRLRLGMLGVHDVPVAGVLLDPGDDAIHHGHCLHRVRAGRRLGRKHQGVRPVVDSRGHVGGLGPRRGRGVDHGVQHLGSHHHRLAGGAAGADDPLLQAGHVFGRHLDPQIAARYHHGVGQRDDLVQALDRRRLLQLGQDGGAVGHQRACLGHVLGALDKGKSDPIHSQTKAEVEVAAVLLGKR